MQNRPRGLPGWRDMETKFGARPQIIVLRMGTMSLPVWVVPASFSREGLPPFSFLLGSRCLAKLNPSLCRQYMTKDSTPAVHLLRGRRDTFPAKRPRLLGQELGLLGNSVDFSNFGKRPGSMEN